MVEQECSPGLTFDAASQLCRDEKVALCVQPVVLTSPAADCSIDGPGYHFAPGTDCTVWTLCPSPAAHDRQAVIAGRGGAASTAAVAMSNIIPPYLLWPIAPSSYSHSNSVPTSVFQRMSVNYLARLQGLRKTRANNPLSRGSEPPPFLRTTPGQELSMADTNRYHAYRGQSWRCPSGTRIDKSRLICRSSDKVSCPTESTVTADSQDLIEQSNIHRPPKAWTNDKK